MVVSMDEALDEMSLKTLAVLCSDELKRYRRKEYSSDRYCTELIRRAVTEQSDQAWMVMQQCFSEIICYWIHNHSSHETVLRLDTEENYVAQTIARFWYAMRDRPATFSSLASALSYLRATLNGILIDAVRTYQRSQFVSLPYLNFLSEAATEETPDDESTWQSIQPLIPDARESRVAYLLYFCGLKPREIMIHCRGEFSDVKEIYNLNKNLLDRLRRNQDRLRRSLAQAE
ncbi:MAG TPA: hypothetical protein VKV40_07510 [Ktedonobacteraceae bacterium]|nr:hypothetical protein [Ktedonobacteraceae bacterium]